MSVAGEIEVVDLRVLQGGRLLSANVRCKKEDPVARLAGGQIRPASVQPCDYEPDVLVAEVPLLLDEVRHGSGRGPPGDEAVERGPSSPERANLGPGHPLPQSRSVLVEAGVGCLASHVCNNIAFINNEQ